MKNIKLKRLLPFLLAGMILISLNCCAPRTHVYASPDYYEYGYSPGGNYYSKPHKHKKHKKYKKQYKKYKKQYKKHHKRHHHDDDDDDDDD